MYVFGGDLSRNGIKQYMKKLWNFVQLPDMFYSEGRYSILRSKSTKNK